MLHILWSAVQTGPQIHQTRIHGVPRGFDGTVILFRKHAAELVVEFIGVCRGSLAPEELLRSHPALVGNIGNIQEYLQKLARGGIGAEIDLVVREETKYVLVVAIWLES